MYRKYKDRGLIILAINMGEQTDIVRDYVKRRRLTFPHMLDTQYEVSGMFSVRGTPTNFLINRKGGILGGGVGYRDWRSQEAIKLLEHLVAQD